MVSSKPRILVLMSGGVDSSVAAALLKEQGYPIEAVTMKIWAGKFTAGQCLHHGCYGPEEDADIEDARRVAEALGIKHQVLDLTQEYQSTILDYFNSEYLAGRTPNPCVRCNLKIKFGTLIDKAANAGIDFDYIASGHYARIQYERYTDRYLLQKARDLSKDQSYFLFALTQAQLQRIIFPLGNIPKSEVRRIASNLGLPVADKPDSQNFISGDYSSVITSEPKPGHILDKQGKVRGCHSGIQNFTVGQRKGLGIAGTAPAYVIDIDAAQNNIIIGEKNDLYCQEFRVSQLNWIAVPELSNPMIVNVKIRSSHKEAEARIVRTDSETFQVTFKTPQFAITPGQAAVFYDGDVVIGGGTIE